MKSDTEAAVKGKQWPLSSYGPFKEKPSLPNLEDQSFEEIRALCYEAKSGGTLQTILPQLSQQVADASYKMSMLCDLNNVNNNMLNMLVNLYNSGESPANNQTALSGGNPFAMSSGVGGGQSNSLFGNSNMTQPQNPFGSNIFGTATATPSSNIFGGATSTSTNSFFGQSNTPFGGGGNATTSVFGGQSAFGGSNPNSFGASSFGQTNSSPFSLSQIGQSAESNSKPSTIFGTSQFQQTQNSIFGGPPAFGNQIVQPTKPSGLFGSTNTTAPSMFGQSQNSTPSGLFSQVNSNQPAGGGNLFGSSFSTQTQQPQQPQSLFGTIADNKSIFGQNANSNQSIFGTNQQQINQSSNIFANAMSQQQANPQNIFGASQPQQEQPSFFSQSNSNPTASNIFQNQTKAPPIGGTIFGGNSGFGQPEPVSQSTYSKLEDLMPEDLEWFKANAFELGKIPTVPPPQELCV